VAGVDVRDVNRLIDEHILPEDLYTNEDSRRGLGLGLVHLFVSIMTPRRRSRRKSVSMRSTRCAAR